jgi:hypothetical protein
MASVGVCVDKQAKPLDQPLKLTNRIKDYFRLK